MNADLLLLAERLVVAMESMSQDMKNVSAYVYDLSVTVSQLLHEKGGKEGVEPVPLEGGDNLPSSTPAAGAPVKGECSCELQDEDTEESPVSENKEAPIGDVAAMSVDHSEISEVISSFTEGIKTEEHTEYDEYDGSCDVYNTDGNSSSNERAAELIETKDFAPDPAFQENQCADTSSNSVVNKGLLKEIDQQPCIESCEASCSFHIARSSMQCPVEVTGMGQEEAADTHLLEHHDTDPLAGVRQLQQSHQCTSGSCANNDGTHGVACGVAPVCVSCERTKRGLRKRTFECSICKKTCDTKFRFAGHKQRHRAERSFKCSHCTKSFKTRHNLIKHVRIHTGERPYKCSQCWKSFKQTSALADHMRIHTGEKPYKCGQCGKFYRCSSNLSRHMRTHTGHRPHKCSHCGISYADSRTLAKHMRKHSGFCLPRPAC